MRWGEYKKGLKNFIDREPLYILMALFIIFINLITTYYNVAEQKGPSPTLSPPPWNGVPFRGKSGERERVRGMSKAQRIIGDREALEKAILSDEKAYITAGIIFLGIALFIILGLVFDFIIFIMVRKKSGLIARSHSPPQANWSIWDAAKVIVLFIFSGYVIVIVEALLSPIFPFLKGENTAVSAVNSTAMDLIAVSAVLYSALRRYRQKIADLGLTVKNFLKNISYGLLGYVSVLPLLVVAFLATALFVSVFKYKPQPQPVMELFMKEERIPMLFYLSLFVAIAGPVMEEIFFRGFLYNAIKKETGIKWAVFISALLFSSLHAHPVGFLPILALGAFLAYLYEKTGSLIAPITLHVTHNLIMLFFVFLLKGVNV